MTDPQEGQKARCERCGDLLAVHPTSRRCRCSEREPAWKLNPDGTCPDCGCLPSEPGTEPDPDDETLGDPCTHPCHDDNR